jgi:hypothetical protein
MYTTTNICSLILRSITTMTQDINPVVTHEHSKIHSNRHHSPRCSRARVQSPAQPRPHEIASHSRSRRCCREASRADCCAFIAYSDNTFVCTYMKREKNCASMYCICAMDRGPRLAVARDQVRRSALAAHRAAMHEVPHGHPLGRSTLPPHARRPSPVDYSFSI